jgi:hypothetical protein
MALANTLNTNEIKDNAGTEVEFEFRRGDGSSKEFKKITELPGFPHRLKVSHNESGAGVSKRRRSVLRFDLANTGYVDATKQIQTSAYLVLDIPVGNIGAYTDAAKVLANLMSFVATTGAASTVLFDGTGTGAAALINGTL